MEKELYIDFDGVILDTQVEIDKLYEAHGGVINDAWNNFLANDIDWHKLLNDSKVIDDSLDILRILYNEGRKSYIFSRVFSLREAQEKINYLRDHNVKTDFVICPGRKNKSEIIIPNTNKLLLEDSNSNVIDWKKNNGSELLFTKNINNLERILELRKYIDYTKLNYDNYLIYLKNVIDNLDIKNYVVTEDTKKDLIALKNIVKLNKVSYLEQICNDSDTLNYCDNLMVLAKKTKLM